jgi:RND family efflux transporter MFP subunit
MANVSPRTDGRLIEVKVKVGQHVREGDPLVRFDARDRKHDLAIAEAQLKSAQGTAASAGADLAAARSKATRRNDSIVVNGQKIAVVSAEEAQQSTLDARGAGGRAASAAGQVAEQRAKVAQLKLAIEELELRAPYDGVVTGVYFEPGMNVHANETTVRVVGAGRDLRIRIAVPEEEMPNISTMKHAQLKFDGRTLPATVERISPEVEPASRTLMVEGAVNLASEDLTLAGRTVQATLSP